ncbi:MAG: acyl--CoA ligase [Sphingomonadales bacterium]|nr:acyl--CoA ligase [Sphingomonadales bacterium]
MPGPQDRDIAAILDALTAPGGPLETVPLARFGTTIPALRHAPPSIAHLLAHAAAEHGELPFLVDGETRLGFAEVHARARRAAAVLIVDHGIRPGDRVGIAARNSANWAVLYFAVLLAGGCATLLNAWWTAPELAQAVALAECRLVLADAERAARLAGAPCPVLAFAHEGPVLAGGGDAALPELGPDDLATLVFTSGSTGEPRAAWSDHRAKVHAALNFAGQALMFRELAARAGTPMQGQPATLASVPLFHVTGEVALLLFSLVIGRKLVMMPRWDAAEAMRLIAAERVTYFLGVPQMSREIALHPDRDRHDLSSCVHFSAGGAARPPAHVAELRAALPHAFPLSGYGLTETNASGCGACNENYLARPASTGVPNRPLVDCAILDEAGQRLPPGETGEIALRSVCNVGGYWRDPAATAALFTPDGYLRTGDLGFLDADGYLTIVDRAKDIVIRGGENIACLEVEHALHSHPDVAEAAVFGVPDARYGEVPVAAWRRRPGATLDAAMLRTFLAPRLAAFKQPTAFHECDAPLPRTGTGKIDKRSLKARFAPAQDQVKPTP